MDKQKNTPNYKKQVLVVFIAAIIAFLSIGMFCDFPEIDDLSYSDFITKLNNDEITEVRLDLKSETFQATVNNEKIYIVQNPKYDDFKKDLLEKGIKVVEESDVNYTSLIFNIIEIGIMLVTVYFVYTFMMKQTKGPSTDILNENTEKTITTKDGKTIPKKQVTFNDVAGLKPVKKDMQLLIEFLKDPVKFNTAGAKMPKGVILSGPPGTGKTLIAKAIAGEANVPFYSVSGSDFIEMFVGVGAKRVRDLFKTAKKTAPCILFIDEIDAIGGARETTTSGNTEHRQTINALLSEMDGFSDSDGVLVIAATNRIEDLDNALIRPGRFDKQITVPLPETAEERLEVINIYNKNKKFAEDVDFKILAKETIGFSPADIEALLNEAALISVQKKLPFINKECIDDAIYKKLLKGHAKDDKNRNLEEIKLVAYHEAGHAVIAKLCDMDVSKVTIVKSTSGAGGVNIIIPKKMGLYSIEELRNQVKMSYGGRCGEMLLYNDFNKVTTGASADIQQATSIISEMITSYGMTENFGMLNLNKFNVDQNLLLTESIKLSKELENETMTLLKEYKDMHKEIVDRLIESETIDGEELDKIYVKYKKDA